MLLELNESNFNRFLSRMKSGQTLNLADFLVSSTAASLSILLILLSCLLGELVTNRFDLFSVEFDRSNFTNWHSYPTIIQKRLAMIALNNQQPVLVGGYANTNCTREAF